MKTIVMNRPGGTEVLEVVDRPDPVARPGQALVEVAAAGVNFMDTGVRRGQFWTEMPLPRGLGVEGMGRVLAVGDGVHSVQPGERVAWVYAPGSYAERIALSADALVHVPDVIDDRTAAADCPWCPEGQDWRYLSACRSLTGTCGYGEPHYHRQAAADSLAH